MQPKARRRRVSAREARLELRRDAVNKRPVYAGLQGGAYKPLKPQDLEKMDQHSQFLRWDRRRSRSPKNDARFERP